MSTVNPLDRPVGEQCPGTSKQTKEQCGLAAGHGTDHVGFGLCKFHGGASPGGRKQAESLKEAWQSRLVDGIDPHLSNVEKLALDEAVEPRTRLAASKDWLDRAGARSENGAAAEGVEIVIRWPDRA